MVDRFQPQVAISTHSPFPEWPLRCSAPWSDDRDEPGAAARIAHRHVAAGEDAVGLAEELLEVSGKLLRRHEAIDPSQRLAKVSDELERRTARRKRP